MITAHMLCAAILSLALPNAETACSYSGEVVEAAHTNDLDPTVLAALISVESNWSVRARNRNSGACGFTQVLPRFTNPRLSCRQLRSDGGLSIRTGARQLAGWISRSARHRGDPLLRGLCGYNAGNSCFTGNHWRSAGMRYARRVTQIASQIRQEARNIQADLEDSAIERETEVGYDFDYGCGL